LIEYCYLKYILYIFNYKTFVYLYILKEIKKIFIFLYIYKGIQSYIKFLNLVSFTYISEFLQFDTTGQELFNIKSSNLQLLIYILLFFPSIILSFSFIKNIVI